MRKNQIVEDDYLGNQKRIYNFVKINPGVHLRRIQRELNLSLGTLRYHLKYLEKQEILSSEQQGNKKIFFIIGEVDSRDKKLIGLLQQKRFRDVIVSFLIEPNQTHKEICEKLSLNPSTLSKYISILIKNGLLKVGFRDTSKIYSVIDKHAVLLTLFTYKYSFWDSLVDRVLHLYFE
ncbi:MAG: winged helix-turn-helix transcriptional regulator [Promethearchaeota archaeon]